MMKKKTSYEKGDKGGRKNMLGHRGARGSFTLNSRFNMMQMEKKNQERAENSSLFHAGKKIFQHWVGGNKSS